MDGAPTGGIELWMGTSNTEGLAVAIAQEAEANGFDGITLGDVECQNPDAFVGLTVAGVATSHLQLGVGVTNPVTRHPAVLACSIASVQHESGGRAVLGIGRGDSAVRKIGLKAATVDELEHYLIRLQRYLSGEKVDEDGPMAQLTWIKEMSVPKVPVDVAASGPETIRAGARQAERVTLNVGADPDRVRGGIELAREARGAAGLEPTSVSMGAVHRRRSPPRPRAGPTADQTRRCGLRPLLPCRRAVSRSARRQGPVGHPERHRPLRHEPPRARRRIPPGLLDGGLPRPLRSGRTGGLLYRPAHRPFRAGVGSHLPRRADRDAPPEVVEESRRLLFTEVMPGVRQAVAAKRGS